MKHQFPEPSFVAFQIFAKMTHLKIYACINLSLLAGCAVQDTHQAKLDQKQLRDVLMDYTQDQILDNLIRAYHGLPIVHFDFARISAGVTSKIVPEVGGGQSVTNVQTRTPTHTTVTTHQTGTTMVDSVVKTLMAVGGVVETVVTPFNYAIGAERDNVISWDQPLLDDPTVYAAYLNFLSCQDPDSSCAAKEIVEPINKITTTEEEPTTITKTTETTVKVGPDGRPPSPTPPPSVDTQHTTETSKKKVSSTVTEAGTQKAFGWEIKGSIRSLQRSASPPPKGAAVVCRLWKDNNYYWVPVDYQKAFFALCLATVARGKPAASSGAEEVTNQLRRYSESTAAAVFAKPLRTSVPRENGLIKTGLV